MSSNDSDDWKLILLLALFTGFIGLLIYTAVVLPKDRFDSIMTAIHYIMIALLVIAVFLFCYYLVKLIKFLNNRAQQKRDSEPIRIPMETINDTFNCKSCGARIEIKHEIHPSIACPFCGATIQALQDAIQRRDNQCLEMYSKQVDSRIYMKHC